MIEKKIHKLDIDLEFKKLIPPLTQEELQLLEENIVRDGCREPLCVWGNIIVDGHNRYEICYKNQIPFYIQYVTFKNREEALNWICANQLGRRNISIETRKYLIGKRYEMEKLLLGNPTGKNQYSKLYSENEGLKEERQRNHRSVTSIKLSKEYKISSRTVIDYSIYAKSLDELDKNEPELVAQVLKGDVKIGQKNIVALSKQAPQIKNKIEKYLELRNKKIKPIALTEHKVTVKDMPKYDPDAEVASLSFTIPSWIGSIDRVMAKANFENISEEAKAKLTAELNNLDFAVETILLAVEGE